MLMGLEIGTVVSALVLVINVLTNWNVLTASQLFNTTRPIRSVCAKVINIKALIQFLVKIVVINV